MINIRNIILTSLLVVLVAGCATSPAPRLYALNAELNSPARSFESTSSVVVLKSVLIPDYLDQKKIVMRVAPYQLEHLEFDRWAEPLDQAIGSAIASTISRLSPGVRVVSYPWTASGEDVLNLKIRLQKFEPTAEGEVVIEGAYEVGGLGVESSYVSFRFVETMAGTNPVDAVAAMSEVIISLGMQISQDVKSGKDK